MNTKHNASRALILILLCVQLAVLLVAGSVDVVTQDFGYLWIMVYGVYGCVILHYVWKGEVYHPLVMLGCSYLFLLGIGSVTFSLFRDRPLNLHAYNLIGIGFLSLVTGMSLVNVLRKPVDEPVISHKVRNVELVYLLAAAGILSVLIMFGKYGGLPIMAANPNEAKVYFLAGNGIFNLFFKGMPVFAMALLYVQFKQGRSLWPAHAYCAIMILCIFFAGYRSTTLISLGEYLLMYIILKGIRIPVSLLAVCGTLAVGFVALVGSFRRGKAGVTAAAEEIDIVINARPMMVELISRNFTSFDYFDGSLYYNDFKRILPGTQVNANVDLKFAIFQNAANMPDIAGVTPSVVGEAYMNFSSPGVLWVLLLLGVFVGLAYGYFQRSRKFLPVAFFLTMVFGLAGGIQSGLGLKIIHLLQFWFWVVIIGLLIDEKDETNDTTFPA